MARYRHDDPHQTKMIAVSYRAIFHQLCNQQKWVGQRPLPNTHQPANQQTPPTAADRPEAAIPPSAKLDPRYSVLVRQIRCIEVRGRRL